MRALESRAAARRDLDRLWHGLHWVVVLYALALLLHGLALCLHAVSACG